VSDDGIQFGLPPDREGLRSLAEYRIRRVEWLDKFFLQRAAFYLLAGRKGVCKGTWICGLAARVTRGELYGEPKRVLVVTSEDSVELDFKPRLLAAGGDERLVDIVVRDFRMPRDLDWLRTTARSHGDVGLISIDPVANHIAGVGTNKEEQVREAIKDLNPIADELDCMVFGVRHLGKDSSRGALAAVLGSVAWVDLPRCVILMAPDDEDEWLFHAQVVAGNRGPRNYGRAFRLELVDVPPATEITRLVPAGESTKNVEELLGVKSGGGSTGSAEAKTSHSAEAREQIIDLLDDGGEMESDELDALVAKSTGLAAKTVRNIRSELASAGLVRNRPEKDEYGAIKRWLVHRTLASLSDAEQPDPEDAEQPDPDFSHLPAQEPLSQATSQLSLSHSLKGDLGSSRSLDPDIPSAERDGTYPPYSDEEAADVLADRAEREDDL
jgi:hypothetical protein